jgi:hypothetical protein
MKVCLDLSSMRIRFSLPALINYPRTVAQVMWLITPPSILFAQNFLSPQVCDYILKSTASSVSNAGSTPHSYGRHFSIWLQLWLG